MPIPFILGGAALLAAGFGAKKGYDAYSDYSDSNEINAEAESILDKALDDLGKTRKEAQTQLEALGKTKFSVYEKSLIPFVEAYKQIQNIDFDESKLWAAGSLAPVTNEQMDDIKVASMNVQNILTGGVTSVGAGGLAGMAAYGSVGLLAKASTGTAIASLSGAAATNATLAWLGGGSLAAGGFGMAGGMAVLGGIVTAPILAVGGMMLASKAAEAKEVAASNLIKAKAEAEQCKTAMVATNGITRRFEEINNILERLNAHFLTNFLPGMQELVAAKNDFNEFSESDQKGLFMTMSLAQTIKSLMEVPILDKNGTLTADSAHKLKESYAISYHVKTKSFFLTD